MQERKASRAKLRVNASAAASVGRNAGPANANSVDHVPKARANKVARQRAKAVKAIKAVKQLREAKVATAIKNGIKNGIRSAMTEVIVTVIAKGSQRNPSAHLNQQTVFWSFRPKGTASSACAKKCLLSFRRTSSYTVI